MVVLSGHYHVLGTDKVGQDVLYQTLKSVRTGLVIGTLTTLIMLPFALLLGIMAGYFRGWVDDVIQYVYTTLNSIPGVLLIAASVLIIQVLMDRNADVFETVTERADVRLLALCHFAQQQQLRELRAQVIVDVPGDANALRLQQLL